MTVDIRINRYRSRAFGFVLLILLSCLKHGNTQNNSVTLKPVIQPFQSTSPVVKTSTSTTTTSKSSDVVTQVSNTASSDLNLSHRNITSLTGLLTDFRTYKVQLLNLSANHLSLLPYAVFANLMSLKCLDLAANNVSLIQSLAFSNLTTLQHLNLSRNSLTALADDTFKGLSSLQQLDLSFNDLANIAPGALELSSLTRLLLAGNQQLGTHSETPLFIATGKRLQTMDATMLSLGIIPSALTHSIRTLHLAQNGIKAVSRGDMDSYPLLQLLDLCSNELTEVEEDALGRLETLTILYLTGNRLSDMPHSLPERLRVLHLERNAITTLQPTDLVGLTQLEVLLLSDNRIRSITDGAFVQVPNLVTLDLSSNPIFELPAGALTGPSQLRVLRLSQLNVSLVAVEETAFPLPETEFLITLDLSGSPTVARQWLEDTAALAAARELQELDLSECTIETLPRDMLHYLPQLRTLHLKNNALNCTGLEWLAEWMRLQEVKEYADVRCQSPGDMWGTLLIDLQSLQEVNIDEKQTKTTSATIITTMARPSITTEETVSKTFNPFVMNILPTALHGVKKNVNRMVADENDILDATIKSIIWPKAIKTSSTQNIVTSTSSTSPMPSTIIPSHPALTGSNLFMKNSSESSGKPSEYANDHKPHQPAAPPGTNEEVASIKSLSLVKQAKNTLENITSHTEASMFSYPTPDKDVPKQPHPGMYLLIVGIISAILVLITVSSRMSRRTRDDLQILRAVPLDQREHNELIEVSSLPSITELW